MANPTYAEADPFYTTFTGIPVAMGGARGYRVRQHRARHLRPVSRRLLLFRTVMQVGQSLNVSGLFPWHDVRLIRYSAVDPRTGTYELWIHGKDVRPWNRAKDV